MLEKLIALNAGRARVLRDRMTGLSSETIETKHCFLKMVQPINENTLPHPRVLEADRSYSFPFLFIVPKTLLPSACTHRTSHPHVKEAHLNLPPSLGDSGPSTEDYAPAATKVSYCINVKVIKLQDDEEDAKAVLVDEQQKIQIVPASEENPPLSIGLYVEDYCLRKVKVIRKGLLRGRMGHIAVEAVQPKSLQIPRSVLEGDHEATPQMTAVTLHLRFDPAGAKTPPPELANLMSKLKVSTFYSASCRPSFPSLSNVLSDRSQNHQSHMLPLSSRSVASAQWERHEPGSNSIEPDSRRGSAVSMTTETPAPSPSYSEENPFYTTTVVVPISLPLDDNGSDAHDENRNSKKQKFLPNFHSCFISRAYTLILSLALEASGMTYTVPMRVPLQISADSGNIDTYALNQDERFDTDADEDERPVAGRQVSAMGSSGKVVMHRGVPSTQSERAQSWSGYPSSDTQPPGYYTVSSSAGNIRRVRISACG